jgi:hypothetical protein
VFGIFAVHQRAGRDLLMVTSDWRKRAFLLGRGAAALTLTWATALVLPKAARPIRLSVPHRNQLHLLVSVRVYPPRVFAGTNSMITKRIECNSHKTLRQEKILRDHGASCGIIYGAKVVYSGLHTPDTVDIGGGRAPRIPPRRAKR